MTTAWRDLVGELDLWASAGRTACFWWRDDDAVATTPALDRLLALHRRSGVPLALAIIPARIEDSLIASLHRQPNIAALQHGYAHHNHATPAEKKSEFPAGRPLAHRLADMRAGQVLMHQHFGDRLLPVFVPPWNRLAPDCLPEMTALGYGAVSAFQARSGYWAAPGLAWLNTHIDPIDWHGADNHAAARRSLAAVCAHLSAMREKKQALEPLGLLTHHLRHDETIWAFTAEFLTTTLHHPAVRWLDARAALHVGAAGATGPAPPAVMPAS
ncbi:MAG: polysaccharide deacetylase family protein [Ferrovibrio sp.]|uniref:polysaccharide deacetylase family protein n=1 Tax=Ferrovibrio sp. TaxID=1917215 RepID=UPI002606DD71|nr:polysaccharide deacetylase family protein [Ferrovibrio sp.]MCW0234697.1 polysaccharide deacetylase family protein [Ferrovibrio sp.]